MPLNDGYGVVIGTIQDYYRDDPDDYGRYFHGHIKINTAGGIYQCAIDVDSKKSSVGVEWRTVPLKASELSTIIALGGGFHLLNSTSSSGAVDYIRSPMFRGRLGCLLIFLLLIGKKLDISKTWKRGVGIDALQDLEPLVYNTKNNGLNAFIFGEPFSHGLGIHNIHQNQGDPPNTPWWNENGIWQDGCTILQQSPEEYVAFMNKFSTQAYSTDEYGHPA